MRLHSVHPHSQDKLWNQTKYTEIHDPNHKFVEWDQATKKPSSTMKTMATKQTIKQQDIPRLVRCMTNVKVTASEKDMKTT